MDFDLTKEQVMFRQAYREVVKREVMPVVEDAEKKQKFPMELYRKLGKLGYLAIGLPREYGALGLGWIEQAIQAEEMSKACSGLVDCIGSSEESAQIIAEFGNEEQKKKYVIPTIKGEVFGCIAITEPNAGSDVAGMETTAVRDGDYYLLNGPKTFISGSPVADYALVGARTDKDAKPSRGISLIVVEKGTPGFPQPRTLEKMGKHSCEVGEFVLQDCRVPAANLIGEEGRGLANTLGTFAMRRIISAAQALGIAVAAHEAAVAYAKTRVQFGQPIGKFQAVSFRLAHLAAEIESVRWLIYRAAWIRENGRECVMEASMAKLLAGELAQRVTEAACQVHGGYGYMREYPVERYFRDARAQTVVVGSSEIQQLVISRQLGL